MSTPIKTVLVGTDLSERCDQAILRGSDIAKSTGAELVVGHVLFAQMGNHPLFPQLYEEEAVSVATAGERIADALANRVAELTGRNPDDFVTLIDQGDAASVLIEQAKRTEADLVVVMAEQDREGSGTRVTRELARSVSCSMLVVGDNVSEGVAIVVLQEEVELVTYLVEALRSITPRLPARIDVVLLMSDPEGEATPLTDQLRAQSAELGVVLEPWFAGVTDTALLGRAATNPSVGLLVVSAPIPNALVKGLTSPLDDIVRLSHASILLLRPPSSAT
jgi:nucleotide-binding universal stress UspA family protein